MKILALVTEAFGGFGGIAKYNQDFLSALCSFREHTEVVALPRLLRSDIGPLPTSLKFIMGSARGKIAYILEALRAVLIDRQFSLIVCGHINLLPLAYVLGRVASCPILLVIYGIDAWTPHKNPLVNRAIRKVLGVVAISTVTKDRFLSWSGLPGHRVFVLPNAIDLTAYGPGIKDDQLLSRYGLHDKIVLMTMGRLSAEERYKGIDEIMDILPNLCQSYPNLAYLVVGDGTDKRRLQEKVEHLGLADHVIFTGYISEEEKTKYYRLADAFVMPGRGEGFGFVFLEAMACGIPVVASSLDGSRDAVQNGKLGIIVNPDDKNELQAGINKALSQPKRVVPDGLGYFSYEKFAQRLHYIVAQFDTDFEKSL